jgi:NTP pyrophosphatase (non-canonical NTP hydrolase)
MDRKKLLKKVHKFYESTKRNKKKYKFPYFVTKNTAFEESVNETINNNSLDQILNITEEECSELIIECTKLKRNLNKINNQLKTPSDVPSDDLVGVIEEIADVKICLHTLAKKLNIQDDVLNYVTEIKIERNKERKFKLSDEGSNNTVITKPMIRTANTVPPINVVDVNKDYKKNNIGYLTELKKE